MSDTNDQWRTIQFFMDSDTGDVDEVEWLDLDGSLRCSCSPSDQGECTHLSIIRARVDLLGGNCLVLLEESAQDEIDAKDLDVTDPGTLRDLVRRFGRIEVV